MIEIVDNDIFDDKTTRINKNQLKSTTPTTSKINEFKDWRGKITQPNLPEYKKKHFFLQNFSFFNNSVRSRLRRQYSATVISPQRPCTAASNLSKSRPDSSGVQINDSQKQEQQIVRQFFFSFLFFIFKKVIFQ